MGREQEIGEVGRLLDLDLPVVVTGEAGIGKTALLREVARASGRQVHEGGGLASTAWLTHLPLRRAFGREFTGDPTAVATEVEALVGPGVLLLDDIHWADPATTECVLLLARRVGVLTAVRAGDPGAEAVVERLRAGGFAVRPVPPMPGPQASALVAATRPELTASQVARVLERAAGNPLLLQELSAEGVPSAGLVFSIAARLRGLPDDVRDLFDLVALAGRPVRRSGLDPDALRTLVDVGLLVPVGDLEVAVRHAVLAEVAVDRLEPGRRRRLHARIARAVDDAGEAAVHHRRAGETALAHAAALRAATTATVASERAGHLALAADTAEGPGADALRLRAAQACEDVHDWHGMVAVLDKLAADDAPRQALAALHRARGAWAAGDVDGLRRELDAGLALVAGSGTAVETRLRIERTRVPIFVEGDYPQAIADGTAALAAAEATGADLPRAHYLLGTALAACNGDGVGHHLQAAIDGARAEDDASTEFLAANNLVSWHESSGDQHAGREMARAFARRAGALGLGEWAGVFRVADVGFALHAGEYATVVEDAETLLVVVREARAHDQLVEMLGVALVDVGRIDEAVRRIEAESMTRDYRGTMQGLLVRMEAALWGGRPAQALALAERYLGELDADVNTPLGEVTRAWARFDLDLPPGPVPTAPVLPMLGGVAPEVEGVGLLHRGDDAAAAAAFARAAALFAPWHRRGELRCRWAAGEATRRTGRVDDAVAALVELEIELLERGMLPLLGRVHRSLRAAGVRRSAPRTHDSRSTLTGRQRQILTFVGDGLTNGEIAHRLGISRYTVVTALGSATAKLGATSRAQAAVLAAGG